MRAKLSLIVLFSCVLGCGGGGTAGDANDPALTTDEVQSKETDQSALNNSTVPDE